MNIDPRVHERRCRFRVAATCAVPIVCPHNYDTCPECDPCTCKFNTDGERTARIAAKLGTFKPSINQMLRVTDAWSGELLYVPKDHRLAPKPCGP